ncbi:MAG: hypothetical protein Q9163_005769 [Psora crenata]
MASKSGTYITEHYPSAAADAGQSIIAKGFKITTRKLPILKAEPIEKMTESLGIAPPEMIFGDNMVSIEHAASGFGINFNTYDALDRVDKTGHSMLQVAHSKEWQSTRSVLRFKLKGVREKKHEGITEVVKPFDWSYSTDYKGTLRPGSPQFQPSTTPIPVGLLKRPDPIQFFDEVMLYEDEMADNGITMLSCKIRVMPERLLLLCRFFMRLDNVLVRIRDTRVYVEFGTGEVIREYQAKEEKYEVVREKLASAGQDVPAQFRDPNNLTDLLPIVDRTLERLIESRYATPDVYNLHYISTTGPHQAVKVPPIRAAKAPAVTSSVSVASDNPPTDEQSSQRPAQFSPARSIAQELRKRASVTTETYVAYGACETLVKECARQAAYKIAQAQDKNVDIPKTKDGEDLGVGEGWWYERLGLPPTFNTWAQVTFLHMYFLTCRFRVFPPAYAPIWHQHLLDHFFFLAEDRMTTQHGMVAGSVRSKYLKDLFVQWRGLMAGYDEGLVKGDAVLATAVWRNIFKADADVDFRGVGQVVSYMRGVLQGLERIKDEELAAGDVVFGDPGSEMDNVLSRSKMMGTLVDVKEQKL